MKKDTKRIIIAASLIGVMLGGYSIYKNTLGDSKEKKVEIVIEVDQNEIFHNTVSTNSKTLADLLNEMKDQKIIQLEAENSTYGMFITGMGTDQLYRQDAAQGLYWTYTSDNNEQCVKESFCPAADALAVQDQDTFVFVLSKYEE